MQWAGNLVLVPKNKITVLDISVEEGMKFLVSAGVAKTKNNASKAKVD